MPAARPAIGRVKGSKGQEGDILWVGIYSDVDSSCIVAAPSSTTWVEFQRSQP